MDTKVASQVEHGKRLDDGWVREAGGLAAMDEKL
jgi:hypothetical protein